MTSAVLGPLDGANEEQNRIFFISLPDSRSTYLQEIAVYEKIAGKCLILASISLSIFVTNFSTYMNPLISGGCVVYYQLRHSKFYYLPRGFGGWGGYRS